MTAPPGASADAAVAQAARDVLVVRVPGQAATVQAEYVAYMATIPDGPAKDAGKAVGAAAAAGMLAMRTGDHYDDVVPYVQPPAGPGVFEPSRRRHPSPPGLDVRPFTYDSPSDYRPGGPVNMKSPRYAKDVAELQKYGRSTAQLDGAADGDRPIPRRAAFLQFSRTLRELATLAASTCVNPRGCSAT